jgi:hypothetical protein
VHGLRKTYHRVRNHYGRTQWYSKVTGLKWRLVSVHLKIVVILMQDRCTICTECTFGLEIVLDAPNGTCRCHGSCEFRFGRSVIVLVSEHDRCKVCTKRTIAQKIGLDAPDGTSR